MRDRPTDRGVSLSGAVAFVRGMESNGGQGADALAYSPLHFDLLLLSPVIEPKWKPEKQPVMHLRQVHLKQSRKAGARHCSRGAGKITLSHLIGTHSEKLLKRQLCHYVIITECTDPD